MADNIGRDGYQIWKDLLPNTRPVILYHVMHFSQRERKQINGWFIIERKEKKLLKDYRIGWGSYWGVFHHFTITLRSFLEQYQCFPEVPNNKKFLAYNLRAFLYLFLFL